MAGHRFLIDTARAWSLADLSWDSAVARLNQKSYAGFANPELDRLRWAAPSLSRLPGARPPRPLLNSLGARTRAAPAQLHDSRRCREERFSKVFQPALDTVQRRLETDPKFAADVVAFLYPALRASRIAYRAYSKPCGYAGGLLAELTTRSWAPWSARPSLTAPRAWPRQAATRRHVPPAEPGCAAGDYQMILMLQQPTSQYQDALSGCAACHPAPHHGLRGGGLTAPARCAGGPWTGGSCAAPARRPSPSGAAL